MNTRPVTIPGTLLVLMIRAIRETPGGVAKLTELLAATPGAGEILKRYLS